MQDIPPNLQLTMDGKRFLQFDSGVTDLARFIVFFNEDFVSILRSLDKWVCDATFRSVQVIFTIVNSSRLLHGSF